MGSVSTGQHSSYNSRRATLKDMVDLHYNVLIPKKEYDAVMQTMEINNHPTITPYYMYQNSKIIGVSKGHVVVFDLGGLWIRVLPFAIKDLTELKQLGMSNNYISEMNPGVFYLTKLESLSYSSNMLRTIPDEIKSLKRLKILNVDRNSIVDVSENILKLRNLEALYINQEHLTKDSKEILKELRRKKIIVKTYF